MTSNHVKIPDVKPVIRYLADGLTTIYTYPFPIFATEDIQISFEGIVQQSGYTVQGAGDTHGGTITFETAPVSGTVIVIERLLPIERLTDYLEGGDFSAQSINTELDFIIAALQQIKSGQDLSISFPNIETVTSNILPDAHNRKNKILGFDENGALITYANTTTVTQSDDFTATGTGAVSRSVTAKLSDAISVLDFGAIGDGLTDDTLAIQQALAAHDRVYLPAGTYLISASISVSSNKVLYGAGNATVLQAQNDTFSVIELSEDHAHIHSLKISGGLVGLCIKPITQDAKNNRIIDIFIDDAQTGLICDGGDDASYICEQNTVSNLLISNASQNGLFITVSGSGAAPKQNSFYDIRVMTSTVDLQGCGIYAEHARDNNSFVNCHVQGSAGTDACVRVGSYSDKTLFLNLLTKGVSGALIPNVQLDNGSVNTSILNLMSESDGAAILDNSGGQFDSYNAGFPNKNRFQKTTVTDLNASLMRYDTEYINQGGSLSLDLSHSMHIIDATISNLTVELPNASDAAGVKIMVKKKDNTSNIITITEDSGSGPDGAPFELGGENDYATLLSNGAEWFVISSNRIAGNTRYIDSSGLVDIDMSVNTYILSSFGGAMTARLPPADASKAAGRTVTLKKTDSSSNTITITEQGGNGPDQSPHLLSSQYDSITVLSDGGQWFVVSKYN